MRILIVAAALAALACGPSSQAGGTPEYTYEIVHTYPHDPQAFTEGLFFVNGSLYESTGQEGFSFIRKVKLETGESLQQRDLSDAYFGEGIINWKDKLYQLTWKNEVGFIYDFASFTPKGEFHYPGEGWSMTQDGKRIIMDDGTPELRFWDPETLKETGRLTVTDNGQPVKFLNELEWVKGEIYANIWQTNRIARINPATGKVTGWISLAGLADANGFFVEGPSDVLNGIAYDARGDRLFITGKKWPKLYQIRLVKKSGSQ
jgi:glutaminyl-peptide cyclotransferase